MNAVFAALSNDTRRDILARLQQGETSVGELAGAYDMSLNAVSKHLKTLEEAGLVNRRIAWRVHHISLNPTPLRAASEWLDLYRAYWEQRLDALEDFLARKKGATHGTRTAPVPKNRRKSR